MKIIYFNATNEIGGADSCLFEMVRCLDRKKYEPIVVVPHPGPFSSLYQDIGVAVKYLDLGKLKNTRSLSWFIKYVFLFPFRFKKILSYLYELKPDFIHLNSSVLLIPGLASAVFKVLNAKSKVIWHVRELNLKPALLWNVIRYIVVLLSDCVVSISAAVLKQVGTSNKSFLNLDGVNVSKFRPKKIGTRHGTFTLGWVGRMTEWKGFENCWSCFKELPGNQFKLRVIAKPISGHEDYYRRVKNMVLDSELGKKVDWVEGTDKMLQFYMNIDLLIHLPDGEEPYGMVLVESQAVGTPVVTWDCGGISDTLKNGRTSIMVPKNDIKSAIKAIILLKNDKKRYREMAKAAIDSVRLHYDSTESTKNIEMIYSSLAKKWTSVRR